MEEPIIFTIDFQLKKITRWTVNKYVFGVVYDFEMQKQVLRLNRKQIKNGQHTNGQLNVLISTEMAAIIKAYSRSDNGGKRKCCSLSFAT